MPCCPSCCPYRGRLRDQREELVGLRDAYRDRESVMLGGLIEAPDAGEATTPSFAACGSGCAGSSTRCRQMSRGSTTAPSCSATSRRGCSTFRRLADGRQVWLCWRLGEDAIGFWHDREDGFAGRLPLAYLGDGVARA